MSRRNIQKYKLYEELSPIGGVCVYCGKPIKLTEALTGDSVDIEHIIPRSLLFDDSMSNKTLSHRSCNRDKGSMTARDYMEAKGSADFAAYVERVDLLCKNDRTKRNKLLMKAADIPDDFIDRQLRQSQYIARKAVELLSDICTDVWTTGGSVTAYLRRLWGWDEVLMNLQLPRYREIEGATEWIEYERGSQTHRAERIVEWSKRDDHRHHAIDALTIACTRQGYIQRLNTLSSSSEEASEERSQSALERYFISQQPFTTAEVMERAAGVLISTKAGKRVATPGVRKAGPKGRERVAQHVLVPRGPLSEESVYGTIPDPATGKPVYVIRYPLDAKFGKADKIVDPALRQAVREWLSGGAKNGEPFKWNGQPVRSVRCYTGLGDSAVEPVRYDPGTGTPLGFVKPGNNHHIAFYRAPDGKRHNRICTFWHAVERKRLGLPVIIRQPAAVWDTVLADAERYTPTFLEKLPPAEWTYDFSLQQNEMVVLGLNRDVVRAAIEQRDYKLLGPYLYRMRGMSADDNSMDLWFLQQYETQPRKDALSTAAGRALRVQSFGRMDELSPVKVRVDLLGHITLPDEL